MSRKVTIEVSDLHAEMFSEVQASIGNGEVRANFETYLHELYQNVNMVQNKEEQKEQLVNRDE